MKKKFLILFCFVLMLSLLTAAVPLTASAASAHTETVNLQRANKNERGDGFYFHNPSNTLTLSGLRIETSDVYGMKLKKDVTVVLEGDNYIKASEIALFCPGGFTVKGSGSLTLVSDGRGIVINTNNTSDKVRMLEGSLSITSAQEGICSENAGAALAGGKVSIRVGDPACNAVDTRVLTLSGNIDFDANSSLRGWYRMNITAANLSLTSSRDVLLCEGQATLADMIDKSSGARLEALPAATALVTQSTVKRITPSIIFGGTVPVAVDYVILAAAVLLLAALIVVPILLHRRKIRAMEAAGLAGMSSRKKPSQKRAKNN